MNDYDAYQLVVNGVQPDDKKTTKKSKAKANKIITKDEQIKNLRIKHKIKCISRSCEVPPPIEEFSDLISRYDFNPAFLKCFQSLKYASPTAVQMQSIPVMLEGHNMLTLAPTGSGKTAAFLIPLLHEIVANKIEHGDKCEPRAIVISPTIELAKQTFQECICLVKDLDTADKPRIMFGCIDKNNEAKWRKRLNSADILICTPTRLNKMLSDKDIAARISVENLKWLIIDESDKMLEDTVNSFLKQFNEISTICLKQKNCRVAMFSATQSATVRDWVNTNLKNDLVHVKIGVDGGTVETIKQELRYCMNEDNKLTDMKILLSSGKLKCPCLIFVDKSNSAFQLYKLLDDFGKNITFGKISGDDTDAARRNTIDEFREGKIHFLICTSLLGRGMDFKGVETVVNYDLPKLKEEYIHRIGRCGRAGRRGSAISLWTDDDIMNGLVDVMKIMRASNQPVNEELFELAKKRMNLKKNKSFEKGKKLLCGLKRKYTDDNGTEKSMSMTDKKRKMYFEKCVIRKRSLQKSYETFAKGKEEHE